MKKILCICTNKQDALNMLPVVDELKKNKTIEVIFFNTDPIYHQGIQEILNGERFLQPELGFKKPFYQMNEMERLFNTFKLIKISNIDEKFDGLLLGGFGVLEYFIAKNLKNKFSIKVFLVIDSMLLYPERYILKKRIRKIVYGLTSRQNICDAIFVSGEATKETLICDGVKEEKIIISGLPRFEKLFFMKNEYSHSDKLRILFLTGGFAWHGQYTLERNEQRIINSLLRLSVELKQYVDFSIKVHPRTYWNNNNTIAQNVKIYSSNLDDVYSIIQENDMILSAQQISTLLFESLWLNKMCIYIEPSKKYKLSNPQMLQKSVFICRSESELKSCIEEIIKGKNNSKIYGFNKEYYLSSKSELAKDYISNCILQSLLN